LIDEARRIAANIAIILRGDGGTAAHNRVENAVRTRPRPPTTPQAGPTKPRPLKTAGLSHYVEIGVDEKTDVVRNILNEVARQHPRDADSEELKALRTFSRIASEAPDQLP
jgi:hypothetical protein